MRLQRCPAAKGLGTIAADLLGSEGFAGRLASRSGEPTTNPWGSFRMKKQLLAAAVVGAFASPVAFAQTTLYGIVDIGYQHASGYDNRNKNFVQEGQHSPSRLGVRGSEDLAGGMYAMYGLEMGMPVDNGTAISLGRLA